MRGYNCIMVYNQNKDRLLFCKRKKEPYKGLYNFEMGILYLINIMVVNLVCEATELSSKQVVQIKKEVERES